jgi:hypothetical protein
MKKEFYSRPRWLQWTLAIALTVLFAAIFFAWLRIFPALSWGNILVLPVVMSLGLSTTTPLCRLSGVYQYYSPMLLAYAPNDKLLDLHLGTSFDFIQQFRWSDRGPRARRHILASVLRGMVAVAEEIEAGKRPPEVRVEATSYFFNDKTATRLGFQMETPSWHTRLNFLLHFPEVAACESFVRGRPSMPNILRLRKATASGAEIVANKAKIAALAERIASGA